MFTSDKGPSNTRPLRKPNRLHYQDKTTQAKLALFVPPAKYLHGIEIRLCLFFLFLLSFFFPRGMGGHGEISVKTSSTGCPPAARWIWWQTREHEGKCQDVHDGDYFVEWPFAIAAPRARHVSVSFSWLDMSLVASAGEWWEVTVVLQMIWPSIPANYTVELCSLKD